MAVIVAPIHSQEGFHFEVLLVMPVILMMSVLGMNLVVSLMKNRRRDAFWNGTSFLRNILGLFLVSMVIPPPGSHCHGHGQSMSSPAQIAEAEALRSSIEPDIAIVLEGNAVDETGVFQVERNKGTLSVTDIAHIQAKLSESSQSQNPEPANSGQPQPRHALSVGSTTYAHLIAMCNIFTYKSLDTKLAKKKGELKDSALSNPQPSPKPSDALKAMVGTESKHQWGSEGVLTTSFGFRDRLIRNFRRWMGLAHGIDSEKSRQLAEKDQKIADAKRELDSEKNQHAETKRQLAEEKTRFKDVNPETTSNESSDTGREKRKRRFYNKGKDSDQLTDSIKRVNANFRNRNRYLRRSGRVHRAEARPDKTEADKTEGDKRAEYDVRTLFLDLDRKHRAYLRKLINMKQRYKQKGFNYKQQQAVMKHFRRRLREQRAQEMTWINLAVNKSLEACTMRACQNMRKAFKAALGGLITLPSLADISKGSTLVWDKAKHDLNVTPTPHGYTCSLRSAVEMEILNYEQSEPSKAPTQQGGRTAVSKAPGIETKTLNGGGKRAIQGSYTFKLTFDARRVSRKKHHTELMLVLLPEGEEGQRYCQSATRIRTICVYDGKDSKDLLIANLVTVLKELTELEESGVRYSGERDKYLGEFEHRDSHSNDRKVSIRFHVPADMAAHMALFGCGGIRDKEKHFCTHCDAHVDHRRKPFEWVMLGKEAKVHEIATEHKMPEELLWAVNGGRQNETDSMFASEVLSDANLDSVTIPLPVTIPQAPSVVNATSSPAQILEASRAQPRAFGNMQVDMSGGGPVPRKRQKVNNTASGAAPVGGVGADVVQRPNNPFAKLRLSDRANTVPAGTAVRVVRHYQMDRKSTLTDIINLDRERFCFCALHAHMRLTEALVRPMFDAAEAAGKVDSLAKAFEAHLRLNNVFEQETEADSTGKKPWKKVSFQAYQCWRFLKSLEANGSRPAELAIVRVLREVWPKNERAAGSALEAERFVEGQCQLWQLFDTVVRQMRCKDPTSATLNNFTVNCRDLGARWCILFPENRCSTLYLHTITFHAGAFMDYLLAENLNIGMLENSGAERRHEYGRRAYRASGGGGMKVRGWDDVPNRTEFLTMRGILIWQYGSDLVSQHEAKLRATVTQSAKSTDSNAVDQPHAGTSVESATSSDGELDEDSDERRSILNGALQQCAAESRRSANPRLHDNECQAEATPTSSDAEGRSDRNSSSNGGLSTDSDVGSGKDESDLECDTGAREARAYAAHKRAIKGLMAPSAAAGGEQASDDDADDESQSSSESEAEGDPQP